MACRAHDVVLDRDQRRTVGGGGGRRGTARREREQERGERPGAAHERSARIGPSVRLNHVLVTGTRWSAWTRPRRLITNVSGTPVVPNDFTKLPLTSRS